MIEMKWTSESEALPEIAQDVFYTKPRADGKFWRIYIACILCRHEDVQPEPVEPGERMPTDYYWSKSGYSGDRFLLDGRGWWAPITGIDMPPGAAHQNINGFDCIVGVESQ